MNHPESFDIGSELLQQFECNRQRMNTLYATVPDEAYYSRPITLRNPLVFYEGHVPAFSHAHVVRKALGGPPLDEELEKLFERGIDPDESTQDVKARGNEADQWPARKEVVAFRDEADKRVRAAIGRASEHPDGALEAVYRALEHEMMHHETLMYLWHGLPYEAKSAPADYQPITDFPAPEQVLVEIPAGTATLGVSPDLVPFGWDNEFPAYVEDVSAFRIQRHNVTNADFMAFMDAGGYDNPRWWKPEDWAWVRDQGLSHPHFWQRDGASWYWRGMFERFPLPLSWPVWVTHAEANAYASWCGMRLPTEAEYQRAALGTPEGGERRYPWGDEAPTFMHGVFGFSSFDPQPVGSHPAGASAWGVHDLVGNGWEWTSTPFAPFPGFVAMAEYPEYSTDFFDGKHFVMKGASPSTALELLRPSFRNWFRTRYPYVFASFRCATGEGQ